MAATQEKEKTKKMLPKLRQLQSKKQGTAWLLGTCKGSRQCHCSDQKQNNMQRGCSTDQLQQFLLLR
jgi:hypothetical protein